MHKSQKATSLIEAIVIMTIVSLSLIGVYDFFSSSQKLAFNTSQRIKAIQISREGIEAVTNIRNTNWLLFGADYQNCWNTISYDINCIGNATNTFDIAPGSYISYQDASHRWQLGNTASGSYLAGTYRNDFGVEVGTGGFYVQSGSGITNPDFTREIIISYPEDTNSDGFTNSNDEKMLVESFVQWGRADTHRVTLSHMLSNWKNRN